MERSRGSWAQGEVGTGAEEDGGPFRQTEMNAKGEEHHRRLMIPTLKGELVDQQQTGRRNRQRALRNVGNSRTSACVIGVRWWAT